MPAENREQWLQQMVGLLRPYFEKQVEKKLPEKVHVSCGFPSRKALVRKAVFVGQCFPTRMSQAGYNEVFISPLKANELEVAAILVHELIHAVDDCVNQHKGPFIDMAKKAGLVRPWTCSVPGEALQEILKEMIETVGAYPHSEINRNAFDDLKKQGTRLIKIVCPDASCGVVCRMTRKWLDEDKLPTCACGTKMQEAA